MGPVLYTIYALAHAAIAVLGIQQARRRLTWPIAVVIVLAVTISYDNVMLVLGSAIGEGDTLLVLSRPRFVIHAFLTPVSIAVVVDQARRLGISWTQSSRTVAGTWALTLAMVALGVVELTHLELVAEESMGMLRYTAADAMVPIPAIVSVIVMIIVGWSVRKQTGWSILFILGLISFFGSAAPPIDGMLVLGNLVEVVFVAALLLTEQRAEAADPTDDNDPDLLAAAGAN